MIKHSQCQRSISLGLISIPDPTLWEWDYLSLGSATLNPWQYMRKGYVCCFVHLCIYLLLFQHIFYFYVKNKVSWDSLWYFWDLYQGYEFSLLDSSYSSTLLPKYIKHHVHMALYLETWMTVYMALWFSKFCHNTWILPIFPLISLWRTLLLNNSCGRRTRL